MTTAHIDETGFGRMVVDGRTFSGDLTIIAGKPRPNWRRKQGHVADIQDLAEVLAARPEVLVLGTGVSGLLRPAPDLAARLAQASIRLEAAPTAQAAQRFNELSSQGADVAGAFHLTC